MYFLIDKERKIIFGWSAKSGCSHIKRLFHYLNTDDIENFSHDMFSFDMLPDIIDNYIIILFIRNPYKRLVSGFLDKYNINGSYRKLWSINKELTFENFVDELYNHNYNVIEKHHFTPQLSEAYNNRINLIENLILYDIENIDYKYIEKLYNKTIPQEILNYKGPVHIGIKTIDYKVYNLNIDKYYKYTAKLTNFYNRIIKNKIDEYYKLDFEYFGSKNIIYKINNNNNINNTLKIKLYKHQYI